MHNKKEKEGNKPFFSIIIPVYNTEQYISRCPESCINQTFKDLEIIVVDDCGQDQSMTMIKNYNDKRIRIIHHEKNLGLFQSRLSRIETALGKYILFLDSDDFFDLDTCKILHGFLEQNSTPIHVIGFGMMIEKQKNQQVFLPPKKINTHTLEIVQINWNLVNKCFLKEILLQGVTYIKNFQIPPKFSMGEDLLLCFIFCSFSQKYVGIDSILYYYCYNPHSLSREVQDPKKNIKKNIGFKIYL